MRGLLNFFVHRVAAQEGVEFLLFHTLGGSFLVARAHVAGSWFIFLFGLGALKRNNLSGHIFSC